MCFKCGRILHGKLGFDAGVSNGRLSRWLTLNLGCGYVQRMLQEGDPMEIFDMELGREANRGRKRFMVENKMKWQIRVALWGRRRWVGRRLVWEVMGKRK